MYLYVGMGTEVQVPLEARGLEFPEAGVLGNYKRLTSALGTKLGSSEKSRVCSYSLSCHSSPSISSFCKVSRKIRPGPLLEALFESNLLTLYT